MAFRPVPAVDAASVVLLRETGDAQRQWELFMVRRHARSEFAASVYVFPGGKVDPADRDPVLTRYFDAPMPSDSPDAPALRVAAIRELFEEAGVFLGAAAANPPGTVSALSEHSRLRLHRGEATLVEILADRDITLNLHGLRPFAHWITPESMPRRYDTWFYLATLPGGQMPRHDELETVDSLWITAAEALQRAQTDDFPVVFVTYKLLERMASCPTIDSLYRSISERDLQPVMPRMLQREGGPEFILPGDPDY